MIYVEVCDGYGTPINFTELKTGINAPQGVFNTIKEAITAIRTLSPHNKYAIYLKRNNNPPKRDSVPINFNEFVIIPTGMCIEFRSVNANIRAVELKPNSSVNVGENVHILTLINGTKQVQINGYKAYYQEKTAICLPELEELHQTINSDVLIARLTQEYIENAHHYITPVLNLLKCTRRVTSNFQILLTLFYLEDYFKIIETKIQRLTGIVSIEELEPQFKLIECESYFQKQLEIIVSAKRKRLQVHLKTESFRRALHAASHPSTAGSAVGYRDFLAKFLDILSENLWVQHQLLTVLMQQDIIKENVITVHLKQIDNLLKEAQLLTNQAYYYVHRTKDPTILSEGEESSELVLNIATLGLQGSGATVFKEALITFLNEKAHTKILKDSVVGDNDLLAHLRNYMSDCPDADYFFTRFMKNHPEILTGFGVTCTGLSTIGTLTSTTFTVLKSFGMIGI